MNNRIVDIVASRVNKMRTGYIFTSSDFTDIVKDPAILSRTLRSLAQSGKIRKIGKGRFDKPKKSACSSPIIEMLFDHSYNQ